MFKKLWKKTWTSFLCIWALACVISLGILAKNVAWTIHSVNVLLLLLGAQLKKRCYCWPSFLSLSCFTYASLNLSHSHSLCLTQFHASQCSRLVLSKRLSIFSFKWNFSSRVPIWRGKWHFPNNQSQQWSHRRGMERIFTALLCNVFYCSVNWMLLCCFVKYLVLEEWIMGSSRQYCPITATTDLAWMEHWESGFETHSVGLEWQQSLLPPWGRSEELVFLSVLAVLHGAEAMQRAHIHPQTLQVEPTALPHHGVYKGC